MAFEVDFVVPDQEQLADLSGMSEDDLRGLFEEFRTEKLLRSGYFRPASSRWHIDGWEADTVSLFSSSTGTELAGCHLEYLNPDSDERNQKSPSEIVRGLSDTFGSNWLEKAGGLLPVSDEQQKRMDKIFRVSNLAIVQLMPRVVVTSRVDSLLHRSAKHHYSQPITRFFGRSYDSDLVNKAKTK